MLLVSRERAWSCVWHKCHKSNVREKLRAGFFCFFCAIFVWMLLSKKLFCVICRIPDETVRSWADSFEKVMSSEGKMNI